MTETELNGAAVNNTTGLRSAREVTPPDIFLVATKSAMVRLENEEETEARRLPRSRCKQAVCMLNGFIYVHGGRDGNVPLKDLWSLHIASGLWECVSWTGEGPSYLQEHTMIAHKNGLYIFGGNFQFGSDVQIPLWIFNLDDNIFKKLDEGVGPGSRRGHTCVSYKEAMYMYGGYVDMKGSTGDLWTFEFETRVWTRVEMDRPPVGRHGHSAVAHRRYMWIYGGLSDLHARDDLTYFNFSLRQWSTVKCPNSPPSLEGHSACVIQDVMYIYGGCHEGEPQNNLWSFDIDFQHWSKLETDVSLRPPLTQHRAIILPVYSAASATSGGVRRWSSAPYRTQAPRSNSLAVRFKARPKSLGSAGLRAWGERSVISSLQMPSDGIDCSVVDLETDLSSFELTTRRSGGNDERDDLSEIRLGVVLVDQSEDGRLRTDSTLSVPFPNDLRPLLRSAHYTLARDGDDSFYDNPTYHTDYFSDGCRAPESTGEIDTVHHAAVSDASSERADDNESIQLHRDVTESNSPDVPITSPGLLDPINRQLKSFIHTVSDSVSFSQSKDVSRDRIAVTDAFTRVPDEYYGARRPAKNLAEESWIEMKEIRKSKNKKDSPEKLVIEDLEVTPKRTITRSGQINKSFSSESDNGSADRIEGNGSSPASESGKRKRRGGNSIRDGHHDPTLEPPGSLHPRREAWARGPGDEIEGGFSEMSDDEVSRNSEDFNSETTTQVAREIGYTMYLFGGRSSKDAPNMAVQPLPVVKLFLSVLHR